MGYTQYELLSERVRNIKMSIPKKLQLTPRNAGKTNSFRRKSVEEASRYLTGKHHSSKEKLLRDQFYAVAGKIQEDTSQYDMEVAKI